MKLCKVNTFTAGDRRLDVAEPRVKDIGFTIHKFTARSKPTDKRNIVIFPIFSEFGCETVAAVYCLPKLLQKYFAGKYTIVMGWAGRDYFYRHLVDEFWEIPEEHMWLREYCRAFHHVSRNLRKVEKDAKKYGHVVDVSNIGNVAVFPVLTTCPNCGGSITGAVEQVCGSCRKVFPEPGLFARLPSSKSDAVWLPPPRQEKISRALELLPPRAVGVTARCRKTWGRNLEPIFYERLLVLLEDLGYHPVWLGEKVTSLPCPFERIPDFSGFDLELTLALVSKMVFTVQFWTASSRLAAMMGTPYILFESPDQIWGVGQEGMRLNLLSRGHYKLVICHYKNVYKDNTAGLRLVRQAVRGIERGDFEDIIGMVENKNGVRHLKAAQDRRIGNGG